MNEKILGSIRDVNGIKILSIQGPFNKDTTPDLHKICQEVGKDKLLKAVLLDFTQVTNIDSAAFACMIGFMKDHTGKDIRIGIINAKKMDKDLLDILKIDRIVKIFKSESYALSEILK